MTGSSTPRKQLSLRLWIAIRFVVFGVRGFLLLMFCWIALLDEAFAHGERLLNPFLALPLGLSGALMMLFGVGEWGRWAYMWVFLSTPLAFSFLLLFPNAGLGKESGVLVCTLAFLVSYMLVRRYYRRRNIRPRTRHTHELQS